MSRELEKLSSVAEHNGIVTLHDFDLLSESRRITRWVCTPIRIPMDHGKLALWSAFVATWIIERRGAC